MSTIDDEDDAWSYSFPPSLDSLPLKKAEEGGQESNDNKKEESNGRPSLSISTNNGNSAFNQDEKKPLNGENGADVESQISSSSSTERQASRSSLSLQSPFTQKSTPADPKTTKHDANSIISKDSSGNGLFQDSINKEDTESSIKTSFFSNLSNSVGFQVQSIEGSDQRELLGSPRSADGNVFGSPKSPKIITYRKSNRTISEGDFSPILDAPENVPSEKYDPRLYSDEFFSSTSYRYASMKRNVEFHQLFRSIDLTDRLLDDFACALSREILLQGRIYISETYVCFNSNLLGWVTNLIIPIQDIIGFEKKHTAGLFPNGIAIETKDTKHTFASFISRDFTYDFITTVWEESTGLKLDDPDETNNSSVNNEGTPRLSVDDDKVQDAYSPRITNYIMSIDETEAENYTEGDASEEEDEEEDGDDEDEDEDEGYEEYMGGEVINGTTSNRSSLDQQKITINKLLRFTPNSNYKSIGPDSHSPTEVGDSFTPETNEIELCDEIIDAPLGVVFAVAFSDSNTSYHRRFIETHDGSELSEYNVFHPMEDDPTRSERKYTYRRALGYSIGPKSTKCEVSEVIEHLNFADYINVVTTTATPDVPSGNSFTVKTRYIFTWAENNKTNLKMSFFIKWTGTSWIKGVIEKQSLAGQKAVVSDYIEGLKKEIDENTSYVEGLSLSEPILEEVPQPVTVTPVKIKKPKEVKKPSPASAFFKNNLVYLGYLNLSFFVLLLVILLRLFTVVSESNELIKSQVLINSHLIYAIQGISTNQIDDVIAGDNEKNELWKWVDQTYGKKLSPVEKVKFLTYQLQNIYQDDFDKEKKKKKKSTFNDIKQSVKEFKYQDYLKVDNIPKAIKEQLI
ncbi:hypothetical protein DFJ63DRAFT_340516 [Scheffersomyces coipomensis]|uniref:uncharacterized protein n=1 Tax=Scheffersomyces coipomensis TaxID=1788519 RepID=UPI00315C6913